MKRTLKFVRVERESGYNEQLRRQGAVTGYTYDYMVEINGECRAILSKNSFSTGYHVYDADHEPIVGLSLTSGRTKRMAGRDVEYVAKKADFEFAIERLFTEGVIPTLGELAVRREERAAGEREALKQEAEAKRLNAIQAAGLDLYEALKAAMFLLEGINSRCTNDTVMILNCRKAIAKAEGADTQEEPPQPVDDGSCDPLYGQRIDSADMGEC